VKVHSALASAFVKEGVDTVFGVMGNANLEWWLDLLEAGVDVIHTRQETPAVSMAEGWARATGRVGVATTTRGPGLTQSATGLTVATKQKVPIVVFVGASPRGDQTHGQYLDHKPFVLATGAGYVGVETPKDAQDRVRDAFFRARTERRPIVLDVPMDLVKADFDEDEDEDYVASADLLKQPQPFLPSPSRLAEAVDMIKASRRPVIISGIGAAHGGAEESILRLGDRIGALLASTLPMKGRPESEWNAGIAGLFSTKPAGELFGEADLVIGVGASMDQRTIEGGYSFAGARYVHIDARPPYRMGNDRVADCYLQGDGRTTVEALELILAGDGFSQVGYRTDDVARKLTADPDPRVFELAPGTVDPRRAAAILDELLPREVGLVSGMAHTTGITALSMPKPRPLQLWTTGFIAVGQVIPTAIGVARAVHPDRVAMIEGDIGVMMHVNELDTAARLRLNLLVVIMNDEALGTEFHHMSAHHLPTASVEIACPDLGLVGRSLGCRGRMARTLDDVRAGVEEFLAGEGPYVLDIRITRIPSVAYRRLQYGMDD